jgi:hypothetical protein
MATPQQTPAVPSTQDFEQINDLVTGHWKSQAIRAAVKLGLADHLTGGGLTAEEVAQRAGSAPDTTFRLMRACVTLGLLTADGEGRFYSTPLLAALRTDLPGSLRGHVLAVTLPAQFLAFNTLTDAVFNGSTQVEAALGSDFFTYLEHHPDQAREFSEGLTSLTTRWVGDVATIIDTTGVALAVDVGGANGTLLYLLAEKNQAMRGIVFDRPNVLAGARADRDRRSLADRVELVGGDFFDDVPEADLYLLKFILHDWDDESCGKILRRCRAAMRPQARIAVIELIVGEITNPGPGGLMDLNMLAVVSGRERSLSEYDALLTAAGLLRISVTRARQSPQSVIEAVAI